VVAAVTLVALPAIAQDNAPAKEPRENSNWYFFNGNTNSYPRLDSAAKQIDREINGSLRLLAPTFEDVETFEDQRDNMGIWTPVIGVGKLLSDKWDVFAQTGYSAGKVVTRATVPSLLVLPLHSDVEIQRTTFFAGVGAAWFPFGVVEMDKYDGLRERLRETKPYLVSTLHCNNMGYKAKVKAGPRPIGNFVNTVEEESWWIGSSAIGAGIDVPATRRDIVSFNVQYTFFYDHGDDFNGPSMTFNWKHFFGKRKK